MKERSRAKSYIIFRSIKSPDYGFKDAKNRKLGLEGEVLVLEYEINKLKEANYENLCYTTIKHADGFVFSDSALDQGIYDFVANSKKPILAHDNIERENAYVDFYKEEII